MWHWGQIQIKVKKPDTQPHVSKEIAAGKDSLITIVSFNVEGIRNNNAYLAEVEKDADILLLQEHWLFNCEKALIHEHSQHPRGTVKSVDDQNPLSPWRMPRGYGGAATLWSD